MLICPKKNGLNTSGHGCDRSMGPWAGNPKLVLYLKKIQQTPGTWKDFLHKQVVEGLGYVPTVCWNFLRCDNNQPFPREFLLGIPNFKTSPWWNSGLFGSTMKERIHWKSIAKPFADHETPLVCYFDTEIQMPLNVTDHRPNIRYVLELLLLRFLQKTSNGLKRKKTIQEQVFGWVHGNYHMLTSSLRSLC